MDLIWPRMLAVLLVVPALVVGYRLLLARRRAEAGDLGTMLPSVARASVRRHLPVGVFALGFAVLGVGAARPTMTVEVPERRGTVILAFDASASMRADDLEPSRLEAAREAARLFIDEQPDAVKIGVVTFNNGGFVVQTPTDDRARAHEAIDRLVAEGPTSLGQGIFTSLSALSDEPLPVTDLTDGDALPELDFVGSAVVVLLSDGENTDQPDPLAIADLAASAGVRVHSVGVGSPEGTTVDVDGFLLATRLDEAMLEAVATATGGDYRRADDTDQLRAIYDDIDLELTLESEHIEVTGILAAAGAALLFVGALASTVVHGRVP